MDTGIEAKIKARSLLLVESHFSRIPDVTFDGSEVTDFKINVNHSVEKDSVVVTALEVTLISKRSDKTQFDARASMVGVFDSENVPVEKLHEFGKINAPAIMFPFVREHLSSLSIKAGLKTILLPLVNFVELAKQNEKQPTAVAEPRK